MPFHALPRRGGVLANARTMNPKPRQQLPADRFFRDLERLDRDKRKPTPANVISMDDARRRLRPVEARAPITSTCGGCND